MGNTTDSAGIAGTWNITADTPMGRQEGTAVLIVRGQTLSGSISVMGKTAPIENGHTDGGAFRFTVQTKVMFKKIEGVASGKRDGDVLSGTIDSNMGTVTFTATRTTS